MEKSLILLNTTKCLSFLKVSQKEVYKVLFLKRHPQKKLQKFLETCRCLSFKKQGSKWPPHNGPISHRDKRFFKKIAQVVMEILEREMAPYPKASIHNPPISQMKTIWLLFHPLKLSTPFA